MSTYLPRRGFLARALGLTAGAVVSSPAVIAAPTVVVDASRERFKTPLEYLQAMQSIGWTPLAMYQRLPGGGVHCMGVEETCPDPDHCARTWLQFHAIQMRTPVQHPTGGDWWKAVWHALYERGLRMDVTPSGRRGA